MNKFYIAAKCNPADFLRGRVVPLDTPQNVGICYDTNDVIEYLRKAEMPESREAASFREVNLPPVQVLFTVTQPGYRVPVTPGQPLEVNSSGVFQYVSIQKIDVTVGSTGIFENSTYSFENNDRRYAKITADDLWARTNITQELLDMTKNFKDVWQTGVFQWYMSIAQQCPAPTSMECLDTKEWTNVFAEEFKKVSQVNTAMNMVEVSAMARLQASTRLLEREIQPAAQAILAAMQTSALMDCNRIMKAVMEKEFSPEQYLKALLKITPCDDQLSFQVQYLAMVDKYKADNPGEPEQNAALFAGASVAQSMSFMYFKAYDHQSQMAFDNMNEKCMIDLERWQAVAEPEFDEHEMREP